MIKEKDIRQIYEGFYKFAEEIKDSKYTRCVVNNLHDLFQLVDIEANGMPTEAEIKLTSLAMKIELEYYKKFIDLSEKQNTLEARAK